MRHWSRNQIHDQKTVALGIAHVLSARIQKPTGVQLEHAEK
jgi:hypothetical protein